MTTKVRVDRRALTDLLRSDPAMAAAMDLTAAKIQTTAETMTPDHTGYARRRYRTRKFPMRRRIENTDWFFHLIEWGSVNNPIYAPFRRAVRALGLEFKATEK